VILADAWTVIGGAAALIAAVAALAAVFYARATVQEAQEARQDALDAREIEKRERDRALEADVQLHMAAQLESVGDIVLRIAEVAREEATTVPDPFPPDCQCSLSDLGAPLPYSRHSEVLARIARGGL
jgi:hypothetical protein